MKTYIFALSFAAIVVYSMLHASCVKQTLASVSRLNTVLAGGR